MGCAKTSGFRAGNLHKIDLNVREPQEGEDLRLPERCRVYTEDEGATAKA